MTYKYIGYKCYGTPMMKYWVINCQVMNCYVTNRQRLQYELLCYIDCNKQLLQLLRSELIWTVLNFYIIKCYNMTSYDMTYYDMTCFMMNCYKNCFDMNGYIMNGQDMTRYMMNCYEIPTIGDSGHIDVVAPLGISKTTWRQRSSTV